MTGTSPFSRSAIVLLVAGAVILFALSVLLHAYDDSPESTGATGSQTSSYATSALGHAGFYDVLRRLDRPVSRSLGNALSMVGSGGTLVVAEPNLNRLSNTDGMKLLFAPRLLLVLPKWRGTKDFGKPAWVSRVEPLNIAYAKRTLALVIGQSNVLRSSWPEKWSVNELGIVPAGSGIVQLMAGDGMRAVVGGEEGMLVGEIVKEGRKIWVVSDPDVLSNHGIVKGDNADFSLALIDRLRHWNNGGGRARIVFDETVHGFKSAADSPVKLMFRFPFVVITILVCMAIVVLLWAATGRFGAPRRPRPKLDFGKRMLVGNGARLLDYAGYHDSVLRRYLSMTMRSVAHALHAPAGMNEPSLVAWLDHIGEARGVERSCSAIFDTVNKADSGNPQHLARLFEAARDIHLWKGEILNGSAKRRHSR